MYTPGVVTTAAKGKPLPMPLASVTKEEEKGIHEYGGCGGDLMRGGSVCSDSMLSVSVLYVYAFLENIQNA